MVARGAVLYFHGASSTRDHGPSDRDAAEAGVELIRHLRPGYDDTAIRPEADLRHVAAEAVAGVGPATESLVAMGWSGGGPYALAAGSLRHPMVRGVCLLGAWGPMEPPDRGLPLGVQLFMRLGRRMPRPLLRASLGAVGLRNPGHVDDVRRVASPWGFTVAQVADAVPVAAWHAERDPEAPIEPWAREPEVRLHRLPGDDHHPTSAAWQAALRWAATLLR